MSRKRKPKPPRLKDVDLSRKLRDEDEYDDKLKTLQVTLLALQQAYLRQQRRGIVVLEGWDTAGKGGLIRRMSTRLDPRQFQVWPIGPPSAEEQGRHYLYRFWQRLPAPGSIAVFDRSWYGRVLVERVEGFAKKAEWQRAYDEINAFEAMLTDDGVRLIKLFLHISKEEQLRRFRERLAVPYKRWKLTADDLRNRAKWDDYVEATDDMVARTHTRAAPWHAVPAEYKWFSRVHAMKLIVQALGKGVDTEPPPADPKIAEAIAAM
jgi:AMP-polyphosphate phosphotransferase